VPGHFRSVTFLGAVSSSRAGKFTSSVVQQACLRTYLRTKKAKNGLWISTALRHKTLWFYCNCVRLYTSRSLYEPFDILAAFSGMCRVMEETFRSPFVFGQPTSYFDFALLWLPCGPSLTLKNPVSSDAKYKDMKLPSWSWCDWKSENGFGYEDQFIEGCVADVCGWLKDHTWIDWHIRDGYGTPQRLWDKDWALEDASADGRWRGYTGSVHDSQPNRKRVTFVDNSSDDSSLQNMRSKIGV